MIKLKQILLIVLCSTLFNCETESTDTTDNSSNDDSTLIKRIVYNKDTSDEFTEIYNYDGNKLTSIDLSDNSKYVYSYDDNNNLVGENYFEEDELIVSIDIEYNTEDKIATYTETFFEPSGLDDRQYEYIFTHNNDGTITNQIYVNYDNSDFELSRTETITLNGENIASISDDDGYTISFTYDDKNNAFKNIHAIEVLNILSENEFGAFIYGNTNNITSYIESDDSSNSDDNFTDRFEYTYNEKNYPITNIYTSQYGNEDADVETIEYFYE